MGVNFYSAVLFLYLAISLRIKGCWEPSLNYEKVLKQWQELRGKNKVMVTHKWVEQAMIIVYYIDNDFRKAKSINSNLDSLIVYHSFKLIDDDKNGIITLAFPLCQNWYLSNNIYKQVFPLICQNWEGLKVVIGFMPYGFWDLTDIVSFDIRLNNGPECRPILFLSYQFPNLFNAKMVYQVFIIVSTN